MMKASRLDFTGSKFSKNEFPKGVLQHMRTDIIETLFDIRAEVEDKHRIFPSPVYEAHVRHNYSESRHSTKNGERLSDATDFFVERKYANIFYATILNNSNVKGMGIYQHSFYKNDKDSYTMFHIDTRPRNIPLLWCACREDHSEDFEYIYLNTDPLAYFQMLSEEGFFY